MKLIDCTFRDGGYQTNWHFEMETVTKYFEAMEKSEIEYLEIGFKFPNKGNSFGPFAFVDSELISSLDISHKFKLGVMINISDFIFDNTLNKSLLKHRFLNDVGYLHFIRIATLNSNLLHVNEASEILKGMGFEIHVNLMQISELDSKDIRKFCKELDEEIAFLTIADTFGVLVPKDIIRIHDLVQNSSRIEMGLHAHDNCGLALANSLQAIDLGFSFIDSTVSGIGRAAGNLRTEFINIMSNEINSINFLKNDLLFNLSHNNFEPLNSKNSWGPSVVYFTGAKMKIHPNTLMSIAKDCTGKEVNVLPLFPTPDSVLNDVSVTKTSDKVVVESIETKPIIPQLKAGFVKGVGVLLLGNGPFLREFKMTIETKLSSLNEDVAVFATSLEPVIDINLINYFVISDTNKFSYLYNQKPSYYEEVFNSTGAKIILPYILTSSVSQNIFSRYTLHEIKTEHNITASLRYALSVITFGDPLEVNLLGFDGFVDDSTRHAEVQACLNSFIGTDSLNNRLFTGTPSLYDIPGKSIFGL